LSYFDSFLKIFLDKLLISPSYYQIEGVTNIFLREQVISCTIHSYIETGKKTGPCRVKPLYHVGE
jgi:hypothetical protein